MKAYVLCLLFILIFGLIDGVNGNSYPKTPSIKNEILDQWKEMDKSMTKMTGSAIKMVLPEMMEIVNELNVSTKCIQQTMQLISGIRRLKVWAFRFLDSSSKIMDGIFTGTFTSTGVYHQCLDSVAPSQDINVPLFKGQYCQIDIRPPLPEKSKPYMFVEKVEELINFTGSEVVNFMAEKAGLRHAFPFKIGLCIPSGCEMQEISQLAQAIGDRNYVTTTVNYCDVKRSVHYSAIAKVTIVFCSLLALLVFIGTGYEIFSKTYGIEYENMGFKVLLSFSVVSNFKSLINTEIKVENLKCLHGIRFIGIAMIIMGHSYIYPLFMMHMYQSQLNVYDMMKEPFGLMIMNSHVVVDTFFFLGGFFVCYMTIKYEKIDNKKLNIVQFICHRLWRVMPVYYFVLLVSMLTPLMGSGPNFKEAIKFSIENCHSYWWANLLFINNFFRMENVCMIHTWYVSCDMQLYLSSLIVLLILLHSQTVGVVLTSVIIMISMIYTGAMTYFYDLVAGMYTVYLDKEFLGDTYLKTYANPISHAGPYYIGILVGYITIMKSDINISKKCQVIGWLVAVMCGVYTMLWTAVWKHYDPTAIETAIYAAIHKNIWTVGVAWMTFCCCTGRGGCINTILSWNVWVPLARLSFLIYLIQPILQTMYIAIFKSTHEFNHFEMIVIYFGILVMSGLLALVCNLLIELPLITIEKLFLRHNKSEENNVFNIEKHLNGNVNLNGDIHTERRNGLEMKELNGYGDNKAFTHDL